MPALVAGIPTMDARCLPKRDGRDKPGHDDCFCHCERNEAIPRGKCRWIEIASARWRGPRNDGYVLLQAVAMQVRAVGVEPGLGALGVGADPEDRAPEARRMIHLDEM